MDLIDALAEALWGIGMDSYQLAIRDDVLAPTQMHRQLAEVLAYSPGLARYARLPAEVLERYQRIYGDEPSDRDVMERFDKAVRNTAP